MTEDIVDDRTASGRIPVVPTKDTARIGRDTISPSDMAPSERAMLAASLREAMEALNREEEEDSRIQQRSVTDFLHEDNL